MRILFQGDSITDAGRNRDDYHDLGPGYPGYAAKFITERHPEIDFEFINLGISGNQTKDLVERLEEDFIEINPDVVSIHIGVNDTWHHAADRSWIDNAVFEERYRTVLSAIKEKTNAKIIMIEQFLLPVEDKEFFREDLDSKIDVERKLAREFADVYVPLDGLMAKASVGAPKHQWSDDGVHPNRNGSELIGKIYADAFDELLGK